MRVILTSWEGEDAAVRYSAFVGGPLSWASSSFDINLEYSGSVIYFTGVLAGHPLGNVRILGIMNVVHDVKRVCNSLIASPLTVWYTTGKKGPMQDQQ